MDRTKITDGIRRWAWDAASQACAWETSVYLGEGWNQEAIRGMANQIEDSAGDIVEAAMDIHDALKLGNPTLIELARKNLGVLLYGNEVLAGKEGDHAHV